MRLPPFNPYIAIFIGTIAISTSAIFVKLAGQAPAAIIAFYRLLFAVLIMMPIVGLKYREEFTQIHRKDWLFSIGAGLFLALHFILWFESLNYTSVASSVVLVSTQPIFAFIGAYLFFHERFSPGAMISIIIVLLGGLIISWGDFQISLHALGGNLLALFGAIMMTGYFLLGQRVRRNVSLITYTFIVYSISALSMLIYNIALKQDLFSYPKEYWAIFLALAIIPTFFGHSLFNWALRWTSTATISMAMALEPVGATFFAYLFLDEMVTWSQWLGGTILLAGLFLFIVSTSRKRKVTISRSQE